jgi:predicted permease
MTRWERFRRLLGRDPKGDVDDELSFHVEMLVKDLIHRGETPEHARELAMRRFGDFEQSRTECVTIDERLERTMARSEYVSELKQDAMYALRALRRTPGFTAVAVLTLALGIGANSAIFSVVHGVLLQGLPYRQAEQLYDVRTLYPDGTGYSLSAPDFMSVREQARAATQVEAYTTGTFALLGMGEPREIVAAAVSDGLFQMLGLRMVLGRAFMHEEHEPGQGMVAVLDHGFWRREMGGDSAVIGRNLTAAGGTYRIVGVIEPRARLMREVAMYRPLTYDSTFSATAQVTRRSEFLRVFARAREGTDSAALDTDLRRVGSRLQEQYPQTNGVLTFTAVPLRNAVLGDVQRPLYMLLGAVGFVLLVACANVANLLLARASARQGELAVRAALGAGRPRLLRQLLTESLVLGVAGGAAGLALAYWSTRALVAARPADIPRLDNVGINSTVVLFTLGLSLLTGLAFGLIPALQSTGERLVRALREGGRGAGAGGHRIRAGLVVAEMALAVALLTGAGLLIRSFVELTRVDAGFNPERAMSFRMVMQGDDYSDGQRIRDAVTALLERMRSLPGVTAVAVTTTLPMSGLGSIVDFVVEGAPPPPDNVNAEIGIASVTPDYEKAIGTSLLRGRQLTDQDRNDSPPVALINEAGVKHWFNGQDPVGKSVQAAGGVSRQIVGVVSDVLQRDPGVPAVPQLFVPYSQRTTRSVRFVVRAGSDPMSLVPAIRREIRSLDSNLPISELAPLDNLLAASVARPRFYTSLLTLFAAAALALAATGIFGVMSYSVAQRTREISIRMALGARGSEVVVMIVRRALLLALAGVAIGIVLAISLGRVLETQLFGVGLLDPLTLTAVVLVLSTSAIIASYLPARRAATLQPSDALRDG